MDPFTIGLLISAAGGLANYLANKSAQEQAAILADKNFQEWMALEVPDPKDQEVVFEQLQSAGYLAPQLDTAVLLNTNAYDEIQENPATQAAQLRALESLQHQGKGGFNFKDKAALQDAQIENGARSKGQSDAILSNLAQRGALNSGAGTAVQLSNVQHQSNQNAQAGLHTAANAQQRALEAIQGAGNLAGRMESNQFNRQSQRAQAQNAIQRFNANNLQNVQNSNTSYLNNAQAANLGNDQRIRDQNVGLRNAEKVRNSDLKQQNFTNRVAKLEGASGARNQQANIMLQQGQNTGQLFANLGGAAAQGYRDYSNHKFLQDYFNNGYRKKPGMS